ncbi:MAG TPA: hypothetical protein VNA30_08100 [Mycobacteriales bacterium]|nr:hypothetical protein [Mycobacteriales bacterium]
MVETVTAAGAPPLARSGRLHAPERQPEHAHLTLAALRDYRRAATTEETKVSYWRRILQARIDVLRAGAISPTSGTQLRPLLTDQRAATRTALLEVMPADDIPPLPNLPELWERQVDPEDAEGLARLDADLTEAEVQLSSYRRVLHERIDAATSELIARYREEPGLCLTALPPLPARQRTG